MGNKGTNFPIKGPLQKNLFKVMIEIPSFEGLLSPRFLADNLKILLFSNNLEKIEFWPTFLPLVCFPEKNVFFFFFCGEDEPFPHSKEAKNPGELDLDIFPFRFFCFVPPAHSQTNTLNLKLLVLRPQIPLFC